MITRQPNLWGELELVDTLDGIVGKTIMRAAKCKSDNGVIKLLQIVFTDGSYCLIVSDDPRVDVNLVSDTERVICGRE